MKLLKILQIQLELFSAGLLVNYVMLSHLKASLNLPTIPINLFLFLFAFPVSHQLWRNDASSSTYKCHHVHLRTLFTAAICIVSFLPSVLLFFALPLFQKNPQHKSRVVSPSNSELLAK